MVPKLVLYLGDFSEAFLGKKNGGVEERLSD